MTWNVFCEPIGNNPGGKAGSVADQDAANVGGMVIYVTNGSARQEVSRVAFVRRNSKNPKKAFDKQLKAEIAKARVSVDLLNEQSAGSGVLQ